jgi:hypothetical protein
MTQSVVYVYQASGGSYHECLVVVSLSYEVVFVAHGSIFYT